MRGLFSGTVCLLVIVATGAGANEPQRRDEERKALPVLRALPVPPFTPSHRLATLTMPGGDAVQGLAFSPIANVLAAGGLKATILWDLSTGKPIRSLPGYSNNFYPESLAFSPDG